MLLYLEENSYCELRRRYHRMRTPEAFSVIVRDIPKSIRTNSKLAEYFDNIYPGKVLHATISWDCSALNGVIHQAEAARHAIEKHLLLQGSKDGAGC